ncbi:hypothetical protein [Oligosphaera ethanolica]|uniref:Uncharacterized protein n=1 Tax=Oligosphaera ethanolica TaxID=760260 RepID=A0AAE4ANQ4_9BACT|nr:hypothetical protein [Oligosphaera ethanolica]MDQ0290514.1 hypothetical protein [Oligosphaera ethanolica]
MTQRACNMVPAIDGVKKGQAMTQRACDIVPAQDTDKTPAGVEACQVFKAYQALSGLQLWKWLLTHNDADLDKTIDTLRKIEAYIPTVVKTDANYRIGRVAQLHLRLLLLLRLRDASPDRPDVEKHRDEVLRLRPKDNHDPCEVSYLQWYKAITLADIGDEAGVSRAVIEAIRFDERLTMQKNCPDIGRRQYRMLRRFVEHHLNVLHNHSLIGQICRALQMPSEGH